MSGDSDSSDDEYEKLKSAVDPDFQRLIEGGTENLSNGSKKSKRKDVSETQLKFNTGHFVHPLRLTPDCQKFVAKRLAESIDKNIKVSKKKLIVQNDAAVQADNEGIYLFSASTERISAEDLSKSQDHKNKVKGKSKRHAPVIRKRKIADDCSSEDEDAKFRSVAVSGDWVLNPMNV